MRAALLLALALVACGGGGTDPTYPPAQDDPPPVQLPAPATASGPSRDYRELNWWGTDVFVLIRNNHLCSPQPACRIPDEDLAIWNRQCAGRLDFGCYIPYSNDPLPRLPGPGASRDEVANWNAHCNTARCVLPLPLG